MQVHAVVGWEGCKGTLHAHTGHLACIVLFASLACVHTAEHACGHDKVMVHRDVIDRAQQALGELCEVCVCMNVAHERVHHRGAGGEQTY